MGSIDKIVYVVAGTGAVGFLGALVLPLVLIPVAVLVAIGIYNESKGKKKNERKS